MAAFTVQKESSKKSYDFETALQLTGYGKYNIAMLCSCILLILAMYLDIFGISVMMPAIACDMSLSIAEQGLLSAVPLMGITVSSYVWGLLADTLGRRKTLFLAMPLASALNFACSMAPNYTCLLIFKLLSAMFISAANAAAFVLLGESVPRRKRSRSMYFMACATFANQLVLCFFAIPIFTLTFNIEIPWLGMHYRPWRLLMQVNSFLGVIGIIMMAFLKESPKFLLSRGKSDEAVDVLRFIHKCNMGNEQYSVVSVHMDDEVLKSEPTKTKSVCLTLWEQTVPLFKPPLLKNSLILYYILLCVYMTSTGYTIWVPTMTNAYFTGDDTAGRTFCEVASRSATVPSNSTFVNCDDIIKPMTLYTVMSYSIGATVLCLLLSFIVGPLGKKPVTLAVITIATCCGILLLFVRIPMLSIVLFYLFLGGALTLGNINTYLVELNPTHLRGMATCLSVVFARGFGFISVQLIASLLADYCTPMVAGYVVLNASGLLVAVFLPPEEKKTNK